MNDTILIIGVILVILMLTLAVSLTLGRRIARRSRWLAIIASAFSIPILIAIVAYADFHISPGNQPDAGSLALAGSLIYAAIALPFTFVTSMVTVLMTTRGAATDQDSTTAS